MIVRQLTRDWCWPSCCQLVSMPGSKVHTKSDITDFASMNSEEIKENFGTDMQHTDYCIWLSA